MKKKLEGELISIAHRVLKLKSHSETVQLQREAKNIYEQLTVLRFYEENFETIKNDISKEQLEEKLEKMALVASNETIDLEEKIVVVAPSKNEVIEEQLEVKTEETVIDSKETSEKEVYATAEDINRIVSEMSNKKNVSDQTLVTTDKVEEPKAKDSQQITFEDFLGSSYKEPEFVRVEDIPKEIEKASEVVFEKKEAIADIVEKNNEETQVVEKKNKSLINNQNTEKQELKSKSLNDKLTKVISFGLNDRIAFEKKLFNGSSDDFNRVISQLNTFDSFEEANSFITSFVKPDYNNWEGNEEYETRFLEIIEKKFN